MTYATSYVKTMLQQQNPTQPHKQMGVADPQGSICHDGRGTVQSRSWLWLQNLQLGLAADRNLTLPVDTVCYTGQGSLSMEHSWSNPMAWPPIESSEC